MNQENANSISFTGTIKALKSSESKLQILIQNQMGITTQTVQVLISGSRGQALAKMLRPHDFVAVDGVFDCSKQGILNVYANRIEKL